MKKMLLLLLYLFPGQDQWHLHKEEGGIRVYSRPYQHKSFKQFRTQMEVETSPEVMTAVIRDSQGALAWVDRAKVFKDLKVVSTSEWYSYTEIEIPFPFKNKDIVTHNQLWQDSLGIGVRIVSEPDFVPTEKGKDRIEKSEASWYFKALPGGKTQVTYLVYSEPDGILPQWLVAPLVAGSLHHTMKNLRQACKARKYSQVPYKRSNIPFE
jgi:hypothetical protein